MSKFTTKPQAAPEPVDLDKRAWQHDVESGDFIFPLDGEGANILTVSTFKEAGESGFGWGLVTSIGDDDFATVAMTVPDHDKLYATADEAQVAAVKGLRQFCVETLKALP